MDVEWWICVHLVVEFRLQKFCRARHVTKSTNTNRTLAVTEWLWGDWIKPLGRSPQQSEDDLNVLGQDGKGGTTKRELEAYCVTGGWCPAPICFVDTICEIKKSKKCGIWRFIGHKTRFSKMLQIRVFSKVVDTNGFCFPLLYKLAWIPHSILSWVWCPASHYVRYWSEFLSLEPLLLSYLTSFVSKW